jgi:Protein of unknown function (DUF2587)
VSDQPESPDAGVQPVPSDGSLPAQPVQVVDDTEEERQDAITEPGKLLRIALMLREMQEEVRRADPDEAGRQRLAQLHETALAQMRAVLTGGLQDEFDALTLPFESDTPTESEIRIAQAQLIGWLEGLFQGIQAAIASQQLSARQQLEQMRTRSLPPGGPMGGHAGPPTGTGQYL